ncbi:response regulator transcription factor [Hyalangium rubrum]|uniref:Response regulator transcription factor n=1 Tax=Hyalangium rubrum TaxID=3103134 RepID=A0ABU5GXD1_9BACT|nr:response regulator transcription factor [Hyalangium sp. s54d21]MDY7225843.1 response regulator transcription factor [Hyalangium sp. s54d21]
MGILEDQQVFMESLVSVFESAGMEVVARCSNVEDFLSSTQKHPPDVALVDLRLEHRERDVVGDGCRAVELLHDFHPNVRPLVLSANRDAQLIERCFRAGAAGYLCKLNVGCSAVLEAVQRVARGERLAPPDLFPMASVQDDASTARGALGRLTSREREVLSYIAAGADNLKIAVCLNITERTVKAHITSIYQKLDVENRTQMAMLACKLGIERPATL